MAQTSIIITSTDTNNKKLQKTLTYANANASSSVLKSVAQQLNALTTNTYEKTDRIDRINCDTEDVPSSGGGGTAKTEPTLTVGTTDRSGFSYTYNGDGDVFVYLESLEMTGYSINRTAKTVSVVGINTTQDGYTGTLYAAEGTNYAAKSVNVSFTVGGGGGETSGKI